MVIAAQPKTIAAKITPAGQSTSAEHFVRFVEVGRRKARRNMRQQRFDQCTSLRATPSLLPQPRKTIGRPQFEASPALGTSHFQRFGEAGLRVGHLPGVRKQRAAHNKRLGVPAKLLAFDEFAQTLLDKDQALLQLTCGGTGLGCHRLQQ